MLAAPFQKAHILLTHTAHSALADLSKVYFFFSHVQSLEGLPQPEHTLFSIGAPQTLHGVHPHF